MIWTDVFQALVIIAGLLAIVIKVRGRGGADFMDLCDQCTGGLFVIVTDVQGDGMSDKDCTDGLMAIII